jgi:hypothetical protein
MFRSRRFDHMSTKMLFLVLFICILFPFKIQACTYPSGWSGCRSEADYTKLSNDISLEQVRNRSTEFNSESYATALTSCRQQIESYTSIMNQYTICSDNELNAAVKRETAFQMDQQCIDIAGSQSFYNSATQSCECKSGFLLINKVCVNAEQYKYNQQQKDAKIEVIFQKYFKIAIDGMPEYKDIVDPSVIKALSLDPINANKTFQQIIIEAYKDKLVKKIPETSTIPIKNEVEKILPIAAPPSAPVEKQQTNEIEQKVVEVSSENKIDILPTKEYRTIENNVENKVGYKVVNENQISKEVPTKNNGIFRRTFSFIGTFFSKFFHR